MKKTVKIIGIILCLIILIGIIFLIINKSYSELSLKVNILENKVYYSDSFEVSKNTIKVYSNMDCAIEIVNVDDDRDSVSIGYLTPGMSESIKLSKNKKYRIKSDVDTDKLIITINGAKKNHKIKIYRVDENPFLNSIIYYGVIKMKSKWYLISSIFQVLVGLIAVVFFIILAINGEVMTRWIITLLLAVAYVVIGTIGIIDNLKK